MIRNIGRGNKVFHIKEIAIRLFLGVIAGKLTSVYMYGPPRREPTLVKKIEDKDGKDTGRTEEITDTESLEYARALKA